MQDKNAQEEGRCNSIVSHGARPALSAHSNIVEHYDDTSASQRRGPGAPAYPGLVSLLCKFFGVVKYLVFPLPFPVSLGEAQERLSTTTEEVLH